MLGGKKPGEDQEAKRKGQNKNAENEEQRGGTSEGALEIGLRNGGGNPRKRQEAFLKGRQAELRKALEKKG